MVWELEKYRKIRSVVTRYLLEHVGEMSFEGSPAFNEERKVWVVPVLCRTSKGILPGGKIELNEELNIVFASPKEEMVRLVEAQLEQLPYLVYAREGELEAAGFEPVTMSMLRPVARQPEPREPTFDDVLAALRHWTPEQRRLLRQELLRESVYEPDKVKAGLRAVADEEAEYDASSGEVAGSEEGERSSVGLTGG